MNRRASLPGAAELFRATSAPAPDADAALVPPAHPGVGAVAGVREIADRAEPDVPPEERIPELRQSVASTGARTVRATRRIRAVSDRAPTGRERHEEKITVYCSAEELLDLESARLNLRADHGMAVDRGRIVREALAVVLADLEAKGDTSILVRRLRES
ncbi:MAG: hypothetical protein M3O28_07650 [Actinomycetota bacterium]|nr:hypothetical protein [Actinomycetota bacterium]